MAATNAHHEIAQTRYTALKARTQAFCTAFLDLSNNPPDKILSEHFTPNNPQITEHGPDWASKRLPFLGRTFSGRDGCLEYFSLLSKTLEFIPSNNTFGGEHDIIVDDRAAATDPGKHAGDGWRWDGEGMVSVKGRATFKAINTSKQWDEEFIYRLSNFGEDGKIGHWEIWADPLSAWVAVGGDKG